jgi:iron complex transport system substrate-binding protein
MPPSPATAGNPPGHPTLPSAVRRALLARGLALTMMSARAGIAVEDDAGNTLQLTAPARRIVALAPHLTELAYAAGAGDRLVGVVAYSDFPPAAQALPQVGSYAALALETVAALKPDLVLAWRSGNREVQLQRLRALGIPVFLNEPHSLADVATSIEKIGRLAGTESTADAAAQAFRTRRAALAARYAGRPPVRMFYQIWDRPLMTVNGDHLISDAMRLCGGRNVFTALAQLAPTVSIESVIAADPEVIIASGMDAARPEWLDQWARWPQLAAAARGNLFFIPPELVQRHTPRILDGAQQMCEALERARGRRP